MEENCSYFHSFPASWRSTSSKWCYTGSVGLNFLDHPPRVPRNIFREPEPENQAAAPVTEEPSAAPAPAQTLASSAVGTVLFRTLRRFPEAYRAVVEALEQVSPDPVPV